MRLRRLRRYLHRLVAALAAFCRKASLYQMGLNRRRDLPAWRLRGALRRQRVNFKFTEILAFTFLSNLTQDKLKTSKGVFLKESAS